LGEDFPDVGIWSLGYEVEPFRWKGNSMPLADRATNVLDLLDSYGIGDRPIIFITHSMGGLLVKQILRNARDYGKWSAIAQKTRGIVFLSTPHSGSDMASWIKHIGGIVQTTVSVEELEAHHSRLRELNLLYRNDEQFSQVPMLVYCETRPTKGILVVNQTSADPGIKGVIPVPMDCDHISICKVGDRKSQIYRQVKRFIQKNLTTPLPQLKLPESELAKLKPSLDSFCGLLEWIKVKSNNRGLQGLYSPLRKKLLQAVYNARKEKLDFGDAEIELLELVVHYSFFCLEERYSPKFGRIKRKDYYDRVQQLVDSKKTIRSTEILLSSLINESKMSKLVEKIEYVNEIK
jgi:hypothetical protein